MHRRSWYRGLVDVATARKIGLGSGAIFKRYPSDGWQTITAPRINKHTQKT